EATMTDEAVLETVGRRIAEQRLPRNLTQDEVAIRAGVSKSTVVRLEDGHSTQLVNLVRILRALDLLIHLEALIPRVPANPLDLIKLQGKTRQRASRKKSTLPLPKKWKWGDEQ
ncbi:MAG: XRE family transcriptional regulator, partial [Desulfobulbaceae bacterium]